MHAIVEVNGQQVQVEEGRYIVVNRLPQDPDTALEFGNVLMVVDGENSVIGAPFVNGAKVTAKILTHFRGPKVLVYKMRRKKGYRRKNGHRQELTRLQIEGLEFPGKKAAAKTSTKAEPKAKKAQAEPAAEAAEGSNPEAAAE